MSVRLKAPENRQNHSRKKKVLDIVKLYSYIRGKLGPNDIYGKVNEKINLNKERKNVSSFLTFDLHDFNIAANLGSKNKAVFFLPPPFPLFSPFKTPVLP